MNDFSVQFEGLIEYLDNQRRTSPRLWFRSMVIHDRNRSSNWVLRQLNQWGIETMARGKGTEKKPSVASSSAWTTFVEISLEGHSKDDLMQAFPEVDDVHDAVTDMMVEGYRFSFSHNKQNDAMIVSVTCKNDDSPNVGCTYTSFAGDWFAALRVAVYKHIVVAEGQWVRDGKPVARAEFG